LGVLRFTPKRFPSLISDMYCSLRALASLVFLLTDVTDASGPITSYSYDADSRLTRSDDTVDPSAGFDVTCAYDAAGNLAQIRASGEGTRTYSYDVAGHLTSYHKPAGAQATTWSVDATYTYDALGQRSSSVVTSGSMTTTTKWTYDGLQLDSLAATSSAGQTWSLTYLYDQEGRPFAGVYRSNESGTTEFAIVTTDRGDVCELADAGGTAFVRYRYDAWGRPLATVTATDGDIPVAVIATRQVLRYAGCSWDAESGLYYGSARSYDAAAMQWLQKDPAKADGEQSAYQYCGGDPMGKVDPTGGFAIAIPLVGAAVVAALIDTALFFGGVVASWYLWKQGKRLRIKIKPDVEGPHVRPGTQQYEALKRRLIKRGGSRAWRTVLYARSGHYLRPHLHLIVEVWLDGKRIFKRHPLIW
jgi:RHS repeat-associated protein